MKTCRLFSSKLQPQRRQLLNLFDKMTSKKIKLSVIWFSTTSKVVSVWRFIRQFCIWGKFFNIYTFFLKEILLIIPPLNVSLQKAPDGLVRTIHVSPAWKLYWSSGQLNWIIAWLPKQTITRTRNCSQFRFRGKALVVRFQPLFTAKKLSVLFKLVSWSQTRNFAHRLTQQQSWTLNQWRSSPPIQPRSPPRRNSNYWSSFVLTSVFAAQRTKEGSIVCGCIIVEVEECGQEMSWTVKYFWQHCL